MFRDQTSFNQDISEWDVSSGTRFVSGFDWWIDVIVIKMMLFDSKVKSFPYWLLYLSYHDLRFYVCYFRRCFHRTVCLKVLQILIKISPNGMCQ
jgi:hypothetical protein